MTRPTKPNVATPPPGLCSAGDFGLVARRCGKGTLPHPQQAVPCAKAFSLWLWMCIPCPRCKAFIGSFKRVFEGKTQWAAKDIVTPVRRGDDPVVAWRMFWDDMLTLHTILLKHTQAPGFFRVPLFRLLSEEEQLLAYGYRFETIATDACVLSGGSFCYTGRYAGHFFRVFFPPWVIQEILLTTYGEGTSGGRLDTLLHSGGGEGDAHPGYTSLRRVWFLLRVAARQSERRVLGSERLG